MSNTTHGKRGSSFAWALIAAIALGLGHPVDVAGAGRERAAVVQSRRAVRWASTQPVGFAYDAAVLLSNSKATNG